MKNLSEKIRNLGWTVIVTVAIIGLVLCINSYRENEKQIAAHRPLEAAGTVIATPNGWTRIPLEQCLGYVIAPTDRTARYYRRVNGGIPDGPYTADHGPADGPVQGVEVRSAEPNNIEIAYSMIR